LWKVRAEHRQARNLLKLPGELKPCTRKGEAQLQGYRSKKGRAGDSGVTNWGLKLPPGIEIEGVEVIDRKKNKNQFKERR